MEESDSKDKRLSYKPNAVGKPALSGRSTVGRRQSLMTKSIEEKKEHLFNKQAADYSFWSVLPVR